MSQKLHVLAAIDVQSLFLRGVKGLKSLGLPPAIGEPTA